MLVLSRKENEFVRAVFDEETLTKMLAKVRTTGVALAVDVSVVKLKGNVVRLGFDADPVVDILRGELLPRSQQTARG